MVNPQQLGGDRMASFVTQPLVVDFVDVVMHDGTLEFRLEEQAVSAASSLSGSTLRSAQFRDVPGPWFWPSADRMASLSPIHRPRM